MNKVTGLAVAAAVVMGLLVRFTPVLSLSPTIAAVAFAIHFAAGGKVGGLIKALASLLAGAVWQVLANMLVLAHESALGPYRWALVGIVAFVVIAQSRFAVLSFIPGGLCGAAMAGHASALRPDGILVGTALIVGALAGFVAEAAGAMVGKKA